MLTRGELRGDILLQLHKSTKNPGYYTETKVNKAIQEAMDFVAVEMFLAGEGWQNKIHPFNVEAGATSVDLPPHISMIKDVYYRYGDEWLPLTYWDREKMGQFSADSSARQSGGCTYRVVDNALYFNPGLADGGDVIQVEYMAYPKVMINDAEFVESHFDRGMQHFIKYKAATILASGYEKNIITWSALEEMWYEKMLAVVTKRNLQSTPIGEFEG